jgi:hypothetical protein
VKIDLAPPDIVLKDLIIRERKMLKKTGKYLLDYIPFIEEEE